MEPGVRFEVNPVLGSLPLRTLVSELRSFGSPLELVPAPKHVCPRCFAFWTCTPTLLALPCGLDSFVDCSHCRGMGA